MEAKTPSASLSLPCPSTVKLHSHAEFNTLFSQLTLSLISSSPPIPIAPLQPNFSSTTISLKPPKWLKPTSRNSPRAQSILKNLSVLERALIGAAGGGIAGAFTYVCLHPLGEYSLLAALTNSASRSCIGFSFTF